MREGITKQYDELHSKILEAEVEVEKWTPLVDREREPVLLPATLDLTHCIKVQRAERADASEDNQILRDTLIELEKPIMQMSNQLSLIQDKFESVL